MSRVVPEDVYVEILARVPVKSAYVCKCVCKFWLRIISSRTFVKMHHDITIQKNNPSLMFTHWATKHGCEISTISYDSIWSSIELDDHPVNVVARDYYPFKYDYIQLNGYCNGLVYSWSRKRKTFSLWNPATREHKRLSRKYTSDHIDFLGFGYDRYIDDYKVIHVVKLWGGTDQEDNRYLVDVYTLGMDKWKSSYTELNNMVVDSSFKAGVLVNGALHWLGTKITGESELIISFDIGDEKFKEMEPPKEHVKNIKNSWMTMVALEGFLCVLVEVVKVQFEVWVMQDYGVEESWTKLHIITHEKIMNYNGLLELVGSFKNGQMLLFSDGTGLLLYDPKHRSARRINMPRIRLSNVVNYVESLVSVNWQDAASF